MTIAKIKPLKKLKGTKGRGRFKRAKVSEAGPTVELSSDRVREAWRYLGGDAADWKLAQKITDLQDKYANNRNMATRLEMIVYEFLERKQVPFVFQHWIAGGRARRGGVVPDFLVNYGGRGIAILPNGDYWHGKAEVAESDIADKLVLLGQWWQGIRIDVVVFIWEHKLRSRSTRERTLELALEGIEVGR